MCDKVNAEAKPAKCPSANQWTFLSFTLKQNTKTCRFPIDTFFLLNARWMKFLQLGIKFNRPFMLGLSDRTKVYVLGVVFYCPIITSQFLLIEFVSIFLASFNSRVRWLLVIIPVKLVFQFTFSMNSSKDKYSINLSANESTQLW